MFYFERLPDSLCYIHLWLSIDILLYLSIYLENTTVFITLIVRSFVVFVCCNLTSGPWNYCVTQTGPWRKKRLGAADGKVDCSQAASLRDFSWHAVGNFSFSWHFHQTNEHPNPGKKFSARGFPRHCYLPDNEKGRKVRKEQLAHWHELEMKPPLSCGRLFRSSSSWSWPGTDASSSPSAPRAPQASRTRWCGTRYTTRRSLGPIWPATATLTPTTWTMCWQNCRPRA